MEKTIRIPRNLTALLQHIQRSVSKGHYYWCQGTIPPNKLSGFLQKWATLGLRADAPARAYRKAKGRASVHFCLSPDYMKFGEEPLNWWILSTTGRDGLLSERPPAPVKDARRASERLVIGDYQLARLAKEWRGADGKLKRETTWTWRLTNQRFQEWEILLVIQAKQRDKDALLRSFNALASMPQFSGVRNQSLKLMRTANHYLEKFGSTPLPIPMLPKMRMIKLWNDEAEI